MKAIHPLLLKLHRWTGLCVGVLLLVQGLTGASLVFRDRIDRIIHPATIVEPLARRVPVQALIDAVSAAHPEDRIDRAEFRGGTDDSVQFQLTTSTDGARLIAVDPYRGMIVRDGTLSAWPTEWLFYLHESWFGGDVGETFVGIEGLILLFLAITGPILWWPGRKRLRQGFRVISGRGADPFWRTLHRAWGAGIAALLIVSATTGVLMVWKNQFRSVLTLTGPAPAKPAPKVPDPIPATHVPVDILIARAQADGAGTALRQLRFSNNGRVVAVFLDSARTVRADGAAQFYFNVATGQEVGRYVAGEMPAGSETIDWLFTIHTGAFGGVATRLLFLTGGLSLAGLAASGMWLWWSRRSRRRAARGARTRAEMA